MTHRLSVIGTGYLGAAHAACMASLGFEVLGLDTDATKVAALAAGRLPFHEPGLPELLRRGLDTGHLRFTASYQEVAGFASVHFLCVGTPQRPGSPRADISQLTASIDALAPLLTRPAWSRGSPPARSARPPVLRNGLPSAHPWVRRRSSRGTRSSSARAMRSPIPCARTGSWPECRPRTQPRCCARSIPGRWPRAARSSSPISATAELVKTAANAFLATKISFINAMAEVCEAAGLTSGCCRRRWAMILGSARSTCRPAWASEVAACRRTSVPSRPGRAIWGRRGRGALLGEIDAINRRCRDRAVALAAELVGEQPARTEGRCPRSRVQGRLGRHP